MVWAGDTRTLYQLSLRGCCLHYPGTAAFSFHLLLIRHSGRLPEVCCKPACLPPILVTDRDAGPCHSYTASAPAPAVERLRYDSTACGGLAIPRDSAPSVPCIWTATIVTARGFCSRLPFAYFSGCRTTPYLLAINGRADTFSRFALPLPVLPTSSVYRRAWMNVARVRRAIPPAAFAFAFLHFWLDYWRRMVPRDAAGYLGPSIPFWPHYGPYQPFSGPHVSTTPPARLLGFKTTLLAQALCQPAACAGAAFHTLTPPPRYTTLAILRSHLPDLYWLWR